MPTLVIFGASGDLTSRKLVPALFALFHKSRLPVQTRIVGFSRTQFTDDQWRTSLAETTAKFVGQDFSKEEWDRFADGIHYQPGDISQRDDFVALAKRLDELESKPIAKQAAAKDNPAKPKDAAPNGKAKASGKRPDVLAELDAVMRALKQAAAKRPRPRKTKAKA